MRELLLRSVRSVAFAALCACGRIDFATHADGGAASDAAELTYRDAVLADQPVGYWRLGDHGPTVHDELGTEDGTYGGGCGQGAGALTGDPNQATTFDGSCLFTFGTSFHFEGTAAFSLELWLLAGTSTSTQFVVMNEERSTANGPSQPVAGYAIVVGQTAVYAERVVGSEIKATEMVPIQTTFHHLVLVFDGTQLGLYSNGVATFAYADARAMEAYSADLDVGGYPGIDNAFAFGAMDELAVYDHALSPDRVALHHDLGINGPRPL